MMFQEQFLRTEGKPLEWEGGLIHTIFRRPLESGMRLQLRWVSAVTSPPQGIALGCKGGQLIVSDTSAKQMVLWRDTSPDEVAIEAVGKGPITLTLWNCWRDDRGVTQAWIGNAAMRFEQLSDEVVRIRSNSRPEVTFNDSVIEVSFVRGPAL